MFISISDFLFTQISLLLWLLLGLKSRGGSTKVTASCGRVIHVVSIESLGTLMDPLIYLPF